MVLTEEECKAAVNDIEYDLCELEERKTGVDVCCLYNENLEIFRELVKEYFQLKEKYNKLLDDVHDYRYETHRMKMTIRNLCKHFGVKNEEGLKNIYLCKPYKLEDLKVGMWIYDIIWEECFEICEIFPKDNEIHVLIHQNRINVKRYEPIKFEEGRFFPVIKAMEYQE